MSKYKEFIGGTRSSAIDDLNDFAKEHEVKVLSYQVVRYEQLHLDITYILVEIIKWNYMLLIARVNKKPPTKATTDIYNN